MTHSTVAMERESGGSTDVAYHTIDVTGLDGANYESYDPNAELGIAADRHGVVVAGVENANSYVVQWDHVNGRLAVEGYGGTDPTAGTAVGEIVLRVEGT